MKKQKLEQKAQEEESICILINNIKMLPDVPERKYRINRLAQKSIDYLEKYGEPFTITKCSYNPFKK